MRILVVDDEPLILSSIRRALSRVGYDVEAASCRDEFISALSKGRYALIIMDIYLDDLSMDEIIEMAGAVDKSVRFLVISGSDQIDGMPYLQKPFRIDELRKRVNEILNE